MIPVVQFHVAGTPAPQGSKIRTRYGMREASSRLEPWREAIVSAAYRQEVADRMLTGAVLVKVVFTFNRPRHHFRTGKFADELRPNAPLHKTTPPDLDKLQRGLGDALVMAAILADDDQIVHWDASKGWGAKYDREGAHISVFTF